MCLVLSWRYVLAEMATGHAHSLWSDHPSLLQPANHLDHKREQYLLLVRGKTFNNRLEAGRPLLRREEVLEERFAELLDRLRFDDEVLTWVSQALRVNHGDEKQYHDGAIRRIQAEYDRLQNRIDGMDVDELDGRIDTDFFDRKAAEWREEQRKCLELIREHQAQTRPTSTRASACSNSRRPVRCFASSPRPKNASCSASYYRTAMQDLERWRAPIGCTSDL
jgi:hypothetical protein